MGKTKKLAGSFSMHACEGGGRLEDVNLFQGPCSLYLPYLPSGIASSNEGIQIVSHVGIYIESNTSELRGAVGWMHKRRGSSHLLLEARVPDPSKIS